MIKSDKRFRSESAFALGPNALFVRVGPGNLWMRCHLSVGIVACTVRYTKGEPCKSKSRVYVSFTHFQRRHDAKRVTKSLRLSISHVSG